MADNYGMPKTDVSELPKISDRMSFIYLERCRINRQDGAITVIDEQGIVHIPAAAITVLLLGPGTDISHRAVELIGDMGVSIVWVGEHGVRYYAHGRALNTKTNLLLKQAEFVSNTRRHLDVVKRMYQLRFKDESVEGLTLQQLRGREGSRMRAAYRNEAKRWGISWKGREYDAEDFFAGDAVNQALSAGNVCLYGLAHAVITSLGCSAGLGFIHTGHECSFAYDIADLYKAEITIPIAFEMAAAVEGDSRELDEEFASDVRRRVRDEIVKMHLLERMVTDIRFLFKDDKAENEPFTDAVYLWDNRKGSVANGIQYRDYEEK